MTAYQNATEPFGGSCTSETRSCTNGALSGSYTNQTCNVTPAANCTTPWGANVNHGNNITAYQSSHALFDQTCSSETRSCNNGTLSGTHGYENCDPYTPLIIVYDSTQAGNANEVLVTIDSTGPYSISWEDSIGNTGAVPSATGPTHTITGVTPGLVTLTISGPLTQLSGTSNDDGIAEIVQWGNHAWTELNFNNENNLIISATDIPILSNITTMAYMFNSADNLVAVMNDWDASNVSDMSYMFNTADDITVYMDNWDLSNVENMAGMFNANDNFTIAGMQNWNTSSVTNMNSMFRSANNFNEDISNWNVANVTNMDNMFDGGTVAMSFYQDLSSWCVTNITSEPTSFDNLATSWVLPRPVWGTCP